MKLAMFSTQPYDRRSFTEALAARCMAVELVCHEARLSPETAVLADGAQAVCVFVNDRLDAATLEALAAQGVRAILLRCAGFNQLDSAAAARHGFFVARVPAYSPEAVAEHAMALILTLNRHTHRAYARVREGNFALEGLLGTNLHGKTAGIVGTGKIGMAAARILHGFGCRLLGFDPAPAPGFAALGKLVALPQLLAESDIVSLHCPLTDASRHMIDTGALALMKPGAMLVNTSRGGLIDTPAVIAALKSRQLGALAIDVYEQESEFFFTDHSSDIIDDDVFQRLMTFPNVLVTGHQGFFTKEALAEIAEATLFNLECWLAAAACPNSIPCSLSPP
jgi:D-lactate dehydrogenase